MQRKMGKYNDDVIGETRERQCTPQNRFWRKEGEFNLSGWGTGRLPGFPAEMMSFKLGLEGLACG